MVNAMLIPNKTLDSEEIKLKYYSLVLLQVLHSAEKWKKRKNIVYIHVLFEN